jgi:hypothetical protein
LTDGNPFGAGVIRRSIAAPEEVRAGALVVGTVVPAEELQLHDLMFRTSARDFPGSGEVIFEDDAADEWFAVPTIYGRKMGGAKSQAERWQQIMTWPRLPTQAEAEAWALNADVQAYNALVDATAVFRQDWAEAEELAALGDDVFWREALSMRVLPGVRDSSTPLTTDGVAFQLVTDTSREVWPRWREQLIAKQEEIAARRIAREAAATGAAVPGYDPEAF